MVTTTNQTMPEDLRLAFERLLEVFVKEYELPPSHPLVLAVQRVLEEESREALEHFESLLASSASAQPA